MADLNTKMCFVIFVLILLNISPATAFGAGNIASISKIEGHNWRHGDIEDMLKTIAFLKGRKWTSMMVKRVYFGNWLRDYSQAMDVGSLKGVQAGSIRILVWILSFLSFGYATAEFEVTEERLGVYRPEEHIDNPKDYADNVDARKYDPRLRPPVEKIELEIDPQTGMKNYIANEKLPIATSTGYVRFSMMRSIHFGRVYTSGASGTRGKETDLCEALRCLGQGLHCLEDFGAHTNYTELVLREMGYRNVFPHTGTATEVDVRGKRIFPLVTGTFGVVDFLHSVLGEATDHFTQSEVDQMDVALKAAEAQNKSGEGSHSTGNSQLTAMTNLLSQVPGAGNLAREAGDLQAQADEQERLNKISELPASEMDKPGQPSSNLPGTNVDPIKTAKQIYPILEFRDKVAKAISATIEKIPGLEKLVEKITDTLTLFILSLLAPFIRPVIDAVSKQLKNGSGGVIDASGKHQYEPWTDAHCSDPTHSLLSKDHFSNILNEPAGQLASTILQYVAPRVIYAWEHPDVPVEQVLNDIVRVFHHPALRDHSCEIHQNMFSSVERWVHGRSDGGGSLDHILNSESVRSGKNHILNASQQSHTHGGGFPSIPGVKIPNIPHMNMPSGFGYFFGAGSHSKTGGGLWNAVGNMREMPDLDQESNMPTSNQIPTCPSCGGSTEGMSEQEATQHANECLDGKAAPLQQQVPGDSGESGPPQDSNFGYSNQPQQPSQQLYQGTEQPDPYQGPQPYGQWQPGYQGPPGPQYPPQDPFQQQPLNYGYNGIPPYAAGYDPNDPPPPPQPYGSGPPHYYGGGPY